MVLMSIYTVHLFSTQQEGTAAALAAQRLLKSMLERTEDSEISKEITANIEYVAQFTAPYNPSYT